MLKLFRRKETLKKFFLSAVLLFISASLVVTLAPLPSADDTGGPIQGRLAEYQGEPVTSLDLQRELDAQLRSSSLGNDTATRARLAPRVLDEILFRRVGVDEARRLGLTVSNEELGTYIRSLSWLNEDGRFVGMDRYQDLVETQTRMSTAQFAANVREVLLTDKLRWLISDSLEVSEEEVRREFHRRNERVSIHYVLFDPSRHLQDVPMEPAKLEQYFAQNAGKYQVPEQRRLRYVLLEPDRVRSEAEVSDDEIRRYYRRHLEEFRVQERVQVSHILFQTLGNSEEEKTRVENRAQEVLQKARAGGDFARLAEEHSEDATAAVGGDLGWVYRGQSVKEFEEAAFGLEPGKISDLIKTTYGMHILKVREKQEAHLETLDQVRDRLRAILESEKLNGAIEAWARKVSQALRDQPASFPEVASRFDLEPRETPLFRRGQPVTDLGGEGAVHDMAFRLREQEVGRPVTVPKGRVIFQLLEKVEAHTPELAQVRSNVEQDYRVAQSGSVAKEKAKEFADTIQQVGSFHGAVRKMRLSERRSRPFTRTDFLDDIGSAASLSRAFSLQKGEWHGPVEAGQNAVVFEVVSREPADEEGWVEQEEAIRQSLLTQKRSLVFAMYRQDLFRALEQSGKLVRYPEAMLTFLAPSRR